jgi:hypothetical protein
MVRRHELTGEQWGQLPPEAREVLESLLQGIRQALGDNLVGVYLRGSLVTGDFEPAASDIDFFAVTERPVSPSEFDALAALHARLSALPTKWGHELEGTYVDRASAGHYRPGERHPTIGRGETLQWTEHGQNWLLERWTVREHGIPLLGPDPQTLIDPVSPDEIRAAVRARLKDWAAFANDLDDPEWQSHLGHKAYVVETMCRAIYTLQTGELQGKPQAVEWALQNLPEPWRATVERSKSWHNDPAPDPSVIPEVRAFVLWAASQAELKPGC